MPVQTDLLANVNRLQKGKDGGLVTFFPARIELYVKPVVPPLDIDIF